MQWFILVLGLVGPFAYSTPADSIHYQIEADPGPLDPSVDESIFVTKILYNTTRTLMRADENGRIVHSLAASHTISPDGLSYEFTIAPDAIWSDGIPVTPQHCVNGILWAMDPKTNPHVVGPLLSIKGAKAFNAGTAPRESVGLIANGRKLTIQLARPQPALLSTLTDVSYAPRRLEIKEPGTPGTPSSGRYFVSDQSTEQIVLTPNPFFKTSGQLPVVFHIVTDEQKSLDMFLSQDLDVILTYPSSALSELEKTATRITPPLWNVTYLGFNTKKPPFNDRNLRMAIAATIDRQSIAATNPNVYMPTRTLIPRTLGGVDVERPQLKEALAKVKKAQTLPPLKLTYTEGEIREQIVQQINEGLQKGLNSTLQSDPVEWTTIALSEDDPLPFYLKGEILTKSDVSELLRESMIRNGDSDPNYEELLNAMDQATTTEERAGLIIQLQNSLLDDAVIIPLVAVHKIYFANPNLKHFAINPYQMTDFSVVRK